MPSAVAALHGGGSALAALSLVKKPSTPTMSCRIWPCNAQTENPSRNAWTMFKEGNSHFRGAWLGNGHDRFGSGSLAASNASQVSKSSAKVLSDGGDENGTEIEKSVSVLEEKPVTVNNSRGNRKSSALVGNHDLLTIPGVGPRNQRKLVEKGIARVAKLRQLYRDKSAEEALKNSGSVSEVNSVRKRRLTFCVEGNISVGKSTFLQRIANETLELRDLVEVVPEPIHMWQDIGPDHFNILDAFYADPQRYAYTFQNYVFVTRVMQERESSRGIKPLRLMERSIFSDRMVFVRAVHEAKWMNEMEISIYDSWFDPVVSCLPGLIPDGFVYLRASPETCYQRMKLRKRAEEVGVTLEYLRDLHEKHESWLFPFHGGNHRVLSVINSPLVAESSLHPDIRDRVFYLEGDHIHSSIQKVPALVLDCEPDIDFSKDVDAKRQYASQVARFFEFVEKMKEAAPPTEANAGGTAQSRQQVLPSPVEGFWMPTGSRCTRRPLDPWIFRICPSCLDDIWDV